MTAINAIIKLSFILVLALLLVGCGPQPTPLDTPTLVDTTIPSPTITATTEPSATLKPSITPTSIAVVVTPPTSTALPFPTKPYPDYHYYEISPDGEWIAWVGAYADIERFPHMIVENLTGDKSWLVIFPHEYQHEFCYDSCWIEPVLWSPDGGYLYYKAYIGGSGVAFSLTSAVAVMRISLRTKETGYLLPPQEYHYTFALSPQGERMVYTLRNQENVEFNLVDLQSLERTSFTYAIQYETFGDIIWSPYDRVFIFNTFDENYLSSIYLVNAQDFSYKKIFEGQLFLHESTDWFSPTEIAFTLPTESVIVNIQTGEITPTD